MKSWNEVRLGDLLKLLTDDELNEIYLTTGLISDFDNWDEDKRLRFVGECILNVSRYKDLKKFYIDRMTVVERFLNKGDDGI